MKRSFIYVFLISFLMFQLLLIYPAGKAFACSCAVRTAVEKLTSYDVVFSGEVIDIGKTRKGEVGLPIREYTFSVKQAWKGVADNRIKIYSYDGSEASCAYTFDKKESYLVYSYKGENGLLQTNLCSGNLKDAAAKDEYALLGNATFIADLSHYDDPPASSGICPWYIAGFIVVFGFIIVFALTSKLRRVK